MPPRAATSSTAMHRSDRYPPISKTSDSAVWLLHAGDVAQWMVQLLGWLWLGQQGMLRGWAVAGGVLAVAVWWAMRVACRGHNWALRGSSGRVALLGFTTAAAVFAWEISPVAGLGGWPGLVVLGALAVVWGLWCALIETRTKGSSLQTGRSAWQPLLAAGLLGAVWALPEGSAGLALGLCAALLYLRDREPALRAHVCKSEQGEWPQLLAPSAMGLMMGTMWLGGDWCLGAGWTQAQMVAAHVALMAGGPAVLALLVERLPVLSGVERPSQAAHDHWCLGLTAAASALWLVGGTVHGALAMGLSSLAWAMHCSRPRSVPAKRSSARPARMVQVRRLALLLGPVLLLWVGLASAQLGPLALQLALVLLGSLAALLLLVSGVQAAKAYLQHQTI